MSLPTKNEIQQIINDLNNRYPEVVDYELSNVSYDVQSDRVVISCLGQYHLGNAYDLVLSLGSEDIMAEMMPDNTGHSQVILEEKEVWLERNKS